MDYHALKRDELAHLCEERGIRGRSHKTKPQLIGLLLAYDAEMADLARLRARRKAGRAKKELPPVARGKARTAGVADLQPAEPLAWPASMTLPSADLQAVCTAAEQAQMIAADNADTAIVPKRSRTIAQTIMRYYWQFPLLYTALNATLKHPKAWPVQFQEGQLFPLTDSKLQMQMQMQTTLYARID